MSPYKIIFLGTPKFAAHHLEQLYKDPHFDVVGVISQPDSPSGRKMKLTPSAVKLMAQEFNIPVFTPTSMKTKESLAMVAQWGAVGAVVVAYGQILSQEFLDLFPQKVVNVHGSLLPRWRGAAPIQRAIMAGDSITGVSLQVMVAQLDAGPIIAETKIEINNVVDALELHDQLMIAGAKLVLNSYYKYLEGQITPTAQNEAHVTYASKISKAESHVNWSQSAESISQNIRGMKMGPGSYTLKEGRKLKLHEIQVVDQSGNPGTVIGLTDHSITVACGAKALEITVLQPESKPKMDCASYLKGYSVQKGEIWE